jgi:hypothetical protein
MSAWNTFVKHLNKSPVERHDISSDFDQLSLHAVKLSRASRNADSW